MLPWNVEALSTVTNVYPAPELDEGNIKAVFLEGLPYKGRHTRVFAYYAVPACPSGAKVPAMVLAHGGGGTAFKEWVRIWTDRGYAAIAMDLEGHLPTEKNSSGERPGHAWSGPARQGEFADYALPMEDQWMYHAVADVLLAHSFLRTFDQIDRDRIGLTGISWGGIITGIVAGVDQRFAFAIPVYGCGYLYEAGNKYGQSFTDMPPECANQIGQLFDPSAYFHRVSMPMLWLTWSHDPHFPLHLLSRSYLAARNGQNDSVMSIHFELRHSHAAGWKRQEIYTFADEMTKGEKRLPQVDRIERIDHVAKVVYHSEVPVIKAELCSSSDTSDWFKVEWISSEATIHTEANEIHAVIPEHTTAYFFQLTDERGCIVSSPIQFY